MASRTAPTHSTPHASAVYAATDRALGFGPRNRDGFIVRG
jgi:hypothetical protein